MIHPVRRHLVRLSRSLQHDHQTHHPHPLGSNHNYSTDNADTKTTTTSAADADAIAADADVIDADKLKIKLTSRKPRITHDILSPTPNYLLNRTLQALLPKSCHPPPGPHNVQTAPRPLSPNPLPAPNHLVYFPPDVPHAELEPDGTDPYHSPGAPFTRRLWAGGSMTWEREVGGEMQMQSQRAVCVETIEDVRVGGTAGREKVFVELQRRYRDVMEDEDAMDGDQERIGYASPDIAWPITEHRTLVFMRPWKWGTEARRVLKGSWFTYKYQPVPQSLSAHSHFFTSTSTPTQSLPLKICAECSEQAVPPHWKPIWERTITPTRNLLAQFSALTYNAHRIHLDRTYCRRVEGYRNMLVHGPLTLTLMVAALRSQIKPGEALQSISYRNLVPIYAEEPMTICLMKKKNSQTEFVIWVLDKNRGMCIKATATVQPRPASLA